MTKMYLRSIKTGVILPYNERIVRAGGVEPVTEEQAFPEKFAPVPLAERKEQVKIDVPAEAAEAPPYTPPELQADASRRFGTPTATRRNKPKTDAATVVAGLDGDF